MGEICNTSPIGYWLHWIADGNFALPFICTQPAIGDGDKPVQDGAAGLAGRVVKGVKVSWETAFFCQVECMFEWPSGRIKAAGEDIWSLKLWVKMFDP